MSEDTKTTNNTVNLDDSDVNGNIKRGELVQQTCYDKLTREMELDLNKEIERHPENDSHIPKNGYPMGSGFVYFIDGTRGAGKTTFLKTVYESASESIKIKLGQLAYIDPSRIEHTEIILLFVLKELKIRVDEQLQAISTRQAEIDYADFRKSFKAIAGGLSLFQTDHDQLKDLDADLFLDWGLERASDSATLRDNLHRLIRITCRILNVKALMLAFDDADTNAASAMKVLESIRKYLDTPQLIVLVTGDMELYSQQVRDHFYENMGKHLTSMDGERREQRTKMVDHLEDQYLLKLFPIRRRVQLGPIWNLIEAPGSGNKEALQLSWKQDNATNLRTFKSAIDELLRRGLRLKNKNDRAFYSTYLLKQPIRSVLQVLSRCAEKLSKNDTEGDLSQEWSKDLSEKLSEGLRSMALGSLYKFGVDVDAIGALEMPSLVDAVFELVVRDGEFDTGAYLRPQSSDIALKSSFAALASDVSRFCANDPSNTLLYMFGGPGSVALWGQVLQHKNWEIEVEKINVSELRTEFKHYIGTGRKEDALNWAWHASTVLTAPYSANPKQRLVQYGVIGLNKRKPKASTGITARLAVKECVNLGRVPAFAFSLIEASGPGVGTFASIFNILGLMDRLFCLEISETETLTKAVLNELAKVYQTPTISRPGWQGNEESLIEDDAEVDETNEYDDAALDVIAERIANWLVCTKPLQQNLKPSAVFIGKIWSRLYFSLDKVSDQHGKRLDAASLMELFALCIINAFLIEELDHHLFAPSDSQTDTEEEAADSNEDDEKIPKDKKMKRDNPVGSPYEFAKKFNHSMFDAKNLPMTFLIASCPLILGLLDREKVGLIKVADKVAGETESIYSTLISHFTPYGATYDQLCDEKTWNLIGQSLIAGHKWPTPEVESKPKPRGRGKSNKQSSPKMDPDT
jgi:hypothetical protein